MLLITRLSAFLQGLARHAALTALYILFATALLISADVLVRKLFGTAFVGADELAGYALAMATSWALAYAFFEGSHIRVNVIHMTLKPRAKALFDVLTVVVTAVLVGALAWQVWVVAFDSWTFDAVSNTPLRLPLWIPQFVFLAGIALYVLSAVIVTLESAGHVMRGDYAKVIALVEESEQAGEYTL